MGIAGKGHGTTCPYRTSSTRYSQLENHSAQLPTGFPQDAHLIVCMGKYYLTRDTGESCAEQSRCHACIYLYKCTVSYSP